jgi:DNA-binding transcriptional regulator LsrR (DeoR family)
LKEWELLALRRIGNGSLQPFPAAIPERRNRLNGDRVSDTDLEEDIKTRVAWLYYMESMTQDQVAQELGLTRSRVLRMLAASRQDGTVQIRVTSKLSRCVELERALEDRFGMERVIVIPRPKDDAATPELIGAMLGAYIDDNLTNNLSIGLGWGKTLSSGLPTISQPSASGLSVVSLLGGLTKVSAFNPSEFAWRFADRLAAECYLMAAPVFAPNAATREALMSHPGIQEVFRRATQLDMAIVSVGDLSPNSTLARYGLLERSELISLEQAGAVGDVLCRFINANGEVIDHQINDRVIAVDPRDLRSARRLVLASGGWHKYTAILAAIKLLRPQILITDELVADRLADARLN